MILKKSEIEYLTTLGLLEVLETKTYFYHYTKYDIGIDKILIDNSLQFSNPVLFNDPFDCNEKLLKIDYSKSDINDTIKNLTPKLNRQQKREIKRKLSYKVNIQELIKSERKKYKLACFSKTCNEVLMWSHYAERHNGICIGFDFPPIYEDNFILCPVRYFNSLKSIDGNTDVLRVILHWLTTKSAIWSYEKEIRAITKSKNDKDYEYIIFDSKCIKEIIFGCNVSEKMITGGIEKLIKSGLDLDKIAIKRMKINDENFLLKEELIKLGM